MLSVPLFYYICTDVVFGPWRPSVYYCFLLITFYSVWPVVAIPLILANLTVLDAVAAMCPSRPVVHIVTTALNLTKTCTSLDMDTVS